MTPADALAQARSFITEQGEAVSIRRYSGTGAGRTKVDTPAGKARPLGLSPKDLVGNVRQGDIKLVMLPDALLGILPLRQTDVVVMRGKEFSIQHVDDNTRRLQGTLVALEVFVRG